MVGRCFPTHHTVNAATYPEENPFHSIPPIYNLTPYTAAGDIAFDSPEFRAAALDIAQRSGVNLLRWQYGTNPFILFSDPCQEFPLDKYTPPPPLQQAILPDDAVFLQQINKHGNAILVTVSVQNEIRLVKIVSQFPFSTNPLKLIIFTHILRLVHWI
jgi:hypothetical protein